MKYEKPIKLVCSDWTVKSTNDEDIVISKKLTLPELAILFGVDMVDILDGKIGMWTLDEEEENHNE